MPVIGTGTTASRTVEPYATMYAPPGGKECLNSMQVPVLSRRVQMLLVQAQPLFTPSDCHAYNKADGIDSSHK